MLTDKNLLKPVWNIFMLASSTVFVDSVTGYNGCTEIFELDETEEQFSLDLYKFIFINGILV